MNPAKPLIDIDFRPRRQQEHQAGKSPLNNLPVDVIEKLLSEYIRQMFRCYETDTKDLEELQLIKKSLALCEFVAARQTVHFSCSKVFRMRFFTNL